MAMKFPLRRYSRRSRTSAADQNMLRERVEMLERADGTGARRLAGVPLPLPEEREVFWIQIDGGSGPDYTAWHEVAFADDGTTFEPDGALEGAGTLVAHEVNGGSGTVGGIYSAR